jgi:hypothetical protein
MLNFSEWDRQYNSIDEAEVSVINWLSRTFGGKIKKLDSILADLAFLEREYASQWEKDQSLIYNLKGQIETGELSEAEEEDFRKKIKEAKVRVATSYRKKIQMIRALNDQAMNIVDRNSRIQKYWELKKSESEVEVMKNLYEISKKLPDKNLEDKLYSDYRKSYDDLKKKEKGIESISREAEREEEKKPEGEEPEFTNANLLIKMSLPEFKSEIKNYSPDKIRSAQRALVDIKNLSMNELRSIRRAKNKEMDKSSAKEKNQVMNKFNPKIYEIGEFIDKIREKISYLDA